MNTPGDTPNLTLRLRKPVALAGETFSVLQLREPTADELVVITQSEGTTADIIAVSRVSGVPQAAIRLIGSGDLVRAADFIADSLKLPEDWPKTFDTDTLELVLRQAVEFDGVTHSVLRLQEPAAGQLEVFNKAKGTERDILAVSIVTGLPRLAIGKILGGDLLRGMAFINSFLLGDPGTGGS